jgi:hypothetical protein
MDAAYCSISKDPFDQIPNPKSKDPFDQIPNPILDIKYKDYDILMPPPFRLTL